MFNNLLRDIDEDPFFSDPFRAHNEHVRQMMRSFSDPFGGHFMPSLTDGRDRGRRMPGQPSSSLALRDEHRESNLHVPLWCDSELPLELEQTAEEGTVGMSQSLSPFGSADLTNTDMRNPFNMFDSMMTNMRSRMDDMHRNFENMSTDSNTHSFSSSSVMTYSKVGNEPPKVFQASSQTRRAPGGIKETRRALKDSESGVEKISIGHHIQDRGHVVERKQNKKTGDREFNQDFQNMDESEAQSFDEEWQREVSKFQPSVPMPRLEAPKPRAAHQAALMGPEQAHREKTKPKPKAEGKKQAHFNDLNVKGSGMTKQ